MDMRQPNRSALTGPLVVVFMILASWPAAPHADVGFIHWIESFSRVAQQAGISRATYAAVFKGITKPDPKVLSAAHHQPEFVTPVWDYLDTRINQSIINKGRALGKEYQSWLDLIESRYNVNRYILLAIWSIESAYGAALNRKSVLRSVIRSLATLAYADPRRRKFARTQLIAAMQIVQNGDVTPAGLRGSWAGAMGHTQFIPTSYQRWAVDIDANGKRDVWTSAPDALASAANLLSSNGWRGGETWGYEVSLPPGFDYRQSEKDGVRIRQWSAQGVRRTTGTEFPRPDQQAILKLPGGAGGPAFLMLKNFYVIKRYNNADKYALAVGHLADRLMGNGGFKFPWPRDIRVLNAVERRELQSRLADLGFYSGTIDGAIGPLSRAGIIKFQIHNGLRADGFATTALIKKLRSLAP